MIFKLNHPIGTCQFVLETFLLRAALLYSCSVTGHDESETSVLFTLSEF